MALWCSLRHRGKSWWAVCVCVCLCWRMTNVSIAIHPVVCAQATFTTAFPVLILVSHKFYIMQMMYSVKSWHILICSGGEPLSQGLIKHCWSIYDGTMYFGLRTCIWLHTSNAKHKCDFCLCDLADPQLLADQSDRSHQLSFTYSCVWVVSASLPVSVSDRETLPQHVLHCIQG